MPEAKTGTKVDDTKTIKKSANLIIKLIQGVY